MSAPGKVPAVLMAAKWETNKEIIKQYSACHCYNNFN